MRVDLQCSDHKKKWLLCDMMQVLVNAMVGIIFQYLRVSKQHRHFQLNVICQLYLNKAGK